MNGTLVLGIVYIITGLITLSMLIHFFLIKGNGLKSILSHLFATCAAHYFIIGVITFYSYWVNKEIISLDNLRLLASFFVILQFFALVRLFIYIAKR